jgi:hypothetical protein
MDTNEQANELYEQWINGNRKDVMRALTAMSSMRAACVASKITWLLSARCTGVNDFLEYMNRRLD